MTHSFQYTALYLVLLCVYSSGETVSGRPLKKHARPGFIQPGYFSKRTDCARYVCRPSNDRRPLDLARPSISLVRSARTEGNQEPESAAGDKSFFLRYARPHELDLLAILSTEAFTPKGAWFDLAQRFRFTLLVWDLQAQFYQRFYHWKDVIKGFKPPISERRYALLCAAKSNGNAIGLTELCVSPCPASQNAKEQLGIDETAPYLSNLSVDIEWRRMGVGLALVEWCEKLSAEWGHNVLFLHVDEKNESAIQFYKCLGFESGTRDMSWYERIGRQDLQANPQILMYKVLPDELLASATAESSGCESGDGESSDKSAKGPLF